VRTPGAATAALSLEKLLENTLDGIVVLDRERRFLVFNSAAERITGYSRSEMLGTGCSCHASLDCHDEQGRSLAGFLCPTRYLGGEDASEGLRQRMRLRRKNGSLVWVETIYTPLRNPAGEAQLFLGVMRDISDSHAHEQDLIATLAELRRENERLLEDQKSRFGFGRIISRSPRMQPVFQRMQAALTTDAGVLIRGERGTGRQLVARAIHEHGSQRDGPFMVLECRGAPRERITAELLGTDGRDGMLAAATGGTLFIRELADLPPEAQHALARVVPVRRGGDGARRPASNVPRVIAATEGEPAGAGRILPELSQRLSVVEIELPPLRERREDIPCLVQHFLDELNAGGPRRVTEVSPKAWSVLMAAPWPGNVAELATAIESAYVVGGGAILQANDLPATLRSGGAAGRGPGDETMRLDPVLERVERQTILEALRRAKGQRNRAAQLMGISRSRLYRRMEILGIAQPASSRGGHA
jgi:PAS domain S-box-containing protein